MPVINTEELELDRKILKDKVTDLIDIFNNKYHPFFIQLSHEITTIQVSQGRDLKTSSIETFINHP